MSPGRAYNGAICAVVAGAVLGGQAVWAATYDWSGAANANWSDPANWGGTVPTSADTAQFNRPVYTNQPALNVAAAVSNVKLTTLSGPVAITAGSPLAVSLTGSTPDAAIDLRSAAADLLIDGDISLAGATFHKFGVASNRTLTVAGNVTGNKRLDITGSLDGDPTGATGAGGIVYLKGAANAVLSVYIKVGTLQVEHLTGLTAIPFLLQGNTVTTPTLRYVGGAATSTWKPSLKLRAGTGYGAIDASGTGALTLGNTGNIACTGDAADVPLQLVLTGSHTGDNTLASGLVNGAGSRVLSLVKSGPGTWVLTGNNTFTGTTTLRDGVLSVATIGNGGVAGNLGKAGSAAANLVFDGGTLRYTGATASTDRNFTINAGQTGTVDVAANALTLSGASAATSGAFVKLGAGTLNLSGANQHTGPTTVRAGTLLVNGVHGAGAQAACHVAGGTLAGSGTIPGSVSVQAGAVLAPGAAGEADTGVLTVNGALDLQSGSTLHVNIASGGCDLVNMAGGESLSVGETAALNVVLGEGEVPAPGTSFTIVSGFARRSGTFAHLPDNAEFDVGGAPFVIHYHSDAIVLTAGKLVAGTLFIVE